MEFYEEIHNIINNMSNHYMDDIISKAEKLFSHISLFGDEILESDRVDDKRSYLKYLFTKMAISFLEFEEKDKFLFIKIIIPLLEKIEINKTQ